MRKEQTNCQMTLRIVLSAHGGSFMHLSGGFRWTVVTSWEGEVDRVVLRWLQSFHRRASCLAGPLVSPGYERETELRTSLQQLARLSLPFCLNPVSFGPSASARGVGNISGTMTWIEQRFKRSHFFNKWVVFFSPEKLNDPLEVKRNLADPTVDGCSLWYNVSYFVSFV